MWQNKGPLWRDRARPWGSNLHPDMRFEADGRWLLLAVAAVLLAGCMNTVKNQAELAPGTGAVAGETDFGRHPTGPAGPVRTTDEIGPSVARGVSYYGDETPATAEATGQPRAAGDSDPLTTGALTRGRASERSRLRN